MSIFRLKKFPIEHERAPEFSKEVTPCMQGGRLEKKLRTDKK